MISLFVNILRAKLRTFARIFWSYSWCSLILPLVLVRSGKILVHCALGSKVVLFEEQFSSKKSNFQALRWTFPVKSSNLPLEGEGTDFSEIRYLKSLGVVLHGSLIDELFEKLTNASQ